MLDKIPNLIMYIRMIYSLHSYHILNQSGSQKALNSTPIHKLVMLWAVQVSVPPKIQQMSRAGR